MAKKNDRLKILIKEGQGNTEGEISNIDENTKETLKPYLEDLAIISSKINDLEERQKSFNTDKANKDEKLIDLKNK